MASPLAEAIRERDEARAMARQLAEGLFEDDPVLEEFLLLPWAKEH